MNLCGSNSCIFGSPAGPGTNGPCSCFDGLTPSESLRVRREINRLEKERDALREQVRVARHTIECDVCGKPTGGHDMVFCRKCAEAEEEQTKQAIEKARHDGAEHLISARQRIADAWHRYYNHQLSREEFEATVAEWVERIT